jgi:hypothetical protein
LLGINTHRCACDRGSRRIDHRTLDGTAGKFVLGGGESNCRDKNCKCKADVCQKMIGTACRRALRSARFQQTLSPPHSRAYGYCHMESLPAGMVASALESRIAYLTKQLENLRARGGIEIGGTAVQPSGSGLAMERRASSPVGFASTPSQMPIANCQMLIARCQMHSAEC